MKLPFDPIDYLMKDYGRAQNDFVNKVVQSVRALRDEGIQESIVVGFDVYAGRVRDEKNADIIASIENNPDAVALRKAIRITDNPDAPAFRIELDLPPLRFEDLKSKVKEKKPGIKMNKTYYEALKKVKANSSLCQARYLDPKNDSSTKKEFYALAAVDALISEYERLVGEKK